MKSDWACQCPTGTTSRTCSQLVRDPCQSHDCNRKGTAKCVVTEVNRFECDCKHGYTGSKCDIDIDWCCSDPCGVAQYCVDGIDSYTCVTPNSFAGTVDAIAVAIEDAACTPHLKAVSWLYALIALALLGMCCYPMFCGSVKTVAYDESEFEEIDMLVAPDEETELTMWILFLIAPDGQRHAVEVMQSEWSIETVQEKVRLAMGIDPQDQVLEYGGRKLKVGKKLTSYGVQHCSEIMVKVKAGAAGVTRQEQKRRSRRRALGANVI